MYHSPQLTSASLSPSMLLFQQQQAQAQAMAQQQQSGYYTPSQPPYGFSPEGAVSPLVYSPHQQQQLQQQQQIQQQQMMFLAMQQQQQQLQQQQQQQAQLSASLGLISPAPAPSAGMMLPSSSYAAFSSNGSLLGPSGLGDLNGGGMVVPAAASSAAPSAGAFTGIRSHHRPTAQRIVIKLTCDLMQTYNQINETYYANKRKKLQAQQQKQQQDAQMQQQSAASAASVASSSSSGAAAASANSGPPRRGVANDGYDDADSNYLVTEGEYWHNNRYQVLHSIGKGSFGRVVKAWDHTAQIFVAIKIVKSKPAFMKQAQVELKLLTSLNKGVGSGQQQQQPQEAAGAAASASAHVSAESGGAAAPASSSSSSSSSTTTSSGALECDRFNIVRMLDSFMHRNHQCIVFELLSLNLYELLRNTKFTGVSLKLLGKFTTQLLMTLAYLTCKERGEERIIHCDLKPENILLRSSRKSAIKVIDFGSACFAHAKAFTYIQSRFYRAAEVILGLNYNPAIDVWSLGCICFELSSGVPLFDGADEHDQILRQVALLGMPPAYLLDKSKKANKFFEKVERAPGSSTWQLRDPFPASPSAAASATYMKIMHGPDRGYAIKNGTTDPRANLRQRLGAKFADTPLWHAFVDLILAMLVWDPKMRIKPTHALEHEFFQISRQLAAEAAQGAMAPAAAAAAAVAHMSVEMPIHSASSSDATSSAAAASVAGGNGWPSAAAPPSARAPVSSIFSDSSAGAAAANNAAYAPAPTLAPPLAAAAPSSATAAVPDAIMHEDSPAAAAAASSTFVPMQPLAPTRSAVAVSSQRADVVTPTDRMDEGEKKKASLAAPSAAASSSSSIHVTPTRKRHIDNRSPTLHHTPKTRALAKQQQQQQQQTPVSAANLFTAPKSSPLTRSAAAAFDAEIANLELPSPSLRSLPRSAVKGGVAIPVSRSTRQAQAALALAQADSSSSDALPPPSTTRSGLSRRSSEAMQDSATAAAAASSSSSATAHDQPQQQQSSPVMHSMITRRQAQALMSPSGPQSPGMHGSNSAWAQERSLASDPLALALGSSLTPLTQSHLQNSTSAISTRVKARRSKMFREASPEPPPRVRYSGGSGEDAAAKARRELRSQRRSTQAAAAGAAGGDTTDAHMDTDESQEEAVIHTRRTRAHSHEKGANGDTNSNLSAKKERASRKSK